MAKQVLILDANVFIEAARRYYAFDFAPGFWEALREHGHAGDIVSIDRVAMELDKGKDQLAKWSKTEFGRAFKATDTNAVIESYGG